VGVAWGRVGVVRSRAAAVVMWNWWTLCKREVAATLRLFEIYIF
jgi:hypothetical protein